MWHHPSPTSRCRGLCRGFCRGCVSRVCVARVRGSRVSRERGWATRGPEQAVYLPLDSGGYPFEWVSMTGDLRSPPQASRGQERHLHPPSSRQEDCHSGHAPDAAPMQLRCSMRRSRRRGGEGQHPAGGHDHRGSGGQQVPPRWKQQERQAPRPGPAPWRVSTPPPALAPANPGGAVFIVTVTHTHTTERPTRDQPTRVFSLGLRRRVCLITRAKKTGFASLLSNAASHLSFFLVHVISYVHRELGLLCGS